MKSNNVFEYSDINHISTNDLVNDDAKTDLKVSGSSMVQTL